MLKKIGAGFLALAFAVSVGGVPTLAHESVSEANAAREVKHVGNWGVLHGLDYKFVEGKNLVRNIVHDGWTLNFEFIGTGEVVVKMKEKDKSWTTYEFIVK